MDIIGLTKEKAIELDDLLIKLHDTKPDILNGFTTVYKVVQQIESLKEKDRNYIQGLLFLARQLPKTIPPLFIGEDILQIQFTNLRQFLYTGGFKKIYADNKIKPWQKKDWYKEQIFKWVITTILGLVAGYITGVSVGKAKTQLQKQEQTEQPARK